MRTTLRISKDVALPLEAVTQTFAILAKRGAGKTNTAVVMTEEMLEAKLPVCVIDPVGVWWGLRSCDDGLVAGYKVLVLGGEHGDIPLTETSGALVADFIVTEHQPTILDVSLFSKSAMRRFVREFAERLYQKNREPLHLVIDEADAFIPQKVDHGMEPLVGAINDVVRRGRARGLGVTLISQRPAVINKDVLTQIECLIVLKMTGPHDRDAIERWVEYNADKDQARTVLASLQELEVGDAWVWSPGWLKLFVRTHIRARYTFDSSATPTAGKQLRPPKELAKIDLAGLQAKMSATLAEAEKNDPKALKRRVAELERELAVRPQGAAVADGEVLALREQVRRLEDELAARAVPDWATTTIRGLASELSKVSSELQALAGLALKACQAVDAAVAGKSAGVSGNSPRPAHTTPKASKGAERGPARPRAGGVTPMVAAETPSDVIPDGDPPTRAQLKMLGVIAQYPEGLDKVRLAVLLGQSHGGGGFNNNLGRFRSQGWVTKGEPIRITKAGLKFGPFEMLPTGDELREYWFKKLDKCPRIILQVLSDVYPKTLTKEQIAERSAKYNDGHAYDPDGGGFNNGLGKLRTFQLINRGKDIAASEALFG